MPNCLRNDIFSSRIQGRVSSVNGDPQKNGLGASGGHAEGQRLCDASDNG
jgi:hypothetical protein